MSCVPSGSATGFPKVAKIDLYEVSRVALLLLVTELQTPRLCLHAIDTAEGERIVGRRAGAEDTWAEDFPFDGDLIGVTAFLTATAARGDQRPFGHYRITRTADGKAIGVESVSRVSRTTGVSRSVTAFPHRRVVTAMQRRHWSPC